MFLHVVYPCHKDLLVAFVVLCWGLMLTYAVLRSPLRASLRQVELQMVTLQGRDPGTEEGTEAMTGAALHAEDRSA